MQFPGNSANLVLGKGGFQKWCSDTIFFCRAVTGAEVSLIIKVGAEDEVGQITSGGDGNQRLKEAGLAVVAPLAVVLTVFRISQFVRFYKTMGNTQFPGEFNGIAAVMGRERFGVSCDSQDLITEFLSADRQQDTGINTSGKGNYGPSIK